MSVKLMMARQWIFNFKWLQVCGSRRRRSRHRRRQRRKRRIRGAADDSTCGWVDTRKQTTSVEGRRTISEVGCMGGGGGVARAGLGAVYPALSSCELRHCR